MSFAVKRETYEDRPQLTRLDVDSRAFGKKRCILEDEGSVGALLNGCAIDATTVKPKMWVQNGVFVLPVAHSRFMTDDELADLSDDFMQLTAVHIPTSQLLTDDGFCHLFDERSELGLIGLEECVNLTDRTLNTIAATCSGLKKLSLIKLERITDFGVQAVLENAPLLTTLNLDWCPITDTTLYAISGSCRTLQELTISQAPKVTIEGFSSIVYGLQDLQTLELWGLEQLNDRWLYVLIQANLQSLTQLDISFSSTTEAGRYQLQEKYPRLSIIYRS